MTKDIYILVGPPASGKSTWIQKEFRGECHVVSTDNIIQAVADDEGKTYNEVFSSFIKEAEEMMWSDFDIYVTGGYTPIIVDRTNMNRKARARFINRLRTHRNDYKIHAVVFPKPEDEEYEYRLHNRPGKTIPEAVINGMLAAFQMPTADEGFDTVSVYEAE